MFHQYCVDLVDYQNKHAIVVVYQQHLVPLFDKNNNVCFFRQLQSACAAGIYLGCLDE